MIIIILLFYQIKCLSRSRASNYQYSVWMIENLWPIRNAYASLESMDESTDCIL